MARMKAPPAGNLCRRGFLKSAGYMAAGAALARAATARANPQTLAMAGGKPTVTASAAKQLEVFRWPPYGPREKEAVTKALDRDAGKIYGYLAELEDKWGRYNQVPFAKTHMNGTSALLSMYFALDLPPGSEILVPSYTFFGTITTMRFFGYVPVFVDVNPRTATFDVEHARKVLTPKTRALVAMHSWGLPCEMDRINDFANQHGLIVLEDCAHAHGAAMQGKKVGNWGRMGIYSFQATKVLPGIEGGMGVYQNRADFERAAILGHYEIAGAFYAGGPNSRLGLAAGSPWFKYVGTGVGLKLRMHPLAAVLILKQMESLDRQNDIINRQVRKLNDRICQLPGLAEPLCRPDQQRVYYNTNMLLLDEQKAGMSRATVVKALQAEGVSIGAGDYPENHKCVIYSEPQWWHHPPRVPKVLYGCQEVNARALFASLFRIDAPDLVEQYAMAFEKVWAHRERLARS
jgi:dTDP-4-amino-4,6-dideoxygalactose transaminase